MIKHTLNIAANILISSVALEVWFKNHYLYMGHVTGTGDFSHIFDSLVVTLFWKRFQ